MYCKIVIDVVCTTRHIDVIMWTDINIECVLWESLMAVSIMTDIMDIDIDMSIFYYLRIFIYLKIFRYWWIFKYWSGYLNIWGYLNIGLSAVLLLSGLYVDYQHH